LSFLRIVILGGQMLKIFMPALNVLFWKQDRLAFGLQRWCLFLVLTVCTGRFVWKISWLLIMFINESIYWPGTGRISNCLNRLLKEVLGCTRYNSEIFFCKVKIFPLLEELPPESFSIFYNRLKVCIVNWFESVNVTDMNHRPNGITLSLGIISSISFS